MQMMAARCRKEQVGKLPDGGGSMLSGWLFGIIP
jgi:hypothetical protein